MTRLFKASVLTSVSALAIIAAGAANAQTFTNDEVAIQSGGNPWTPVTAIPGFTAPTTNGAYVLSGPEGLITTSVANAVGPNGAPAVTYGSEASATTYVAPATNPGNVGGTYAAGAYVVDTTGALVSIANQGACTAAICTWVAPTAIDTAVSWQKVTYAMETNGAASGTLASGGTVLGANTTNIYAAGDVLVTSTGALATVATQCTATAQCTYKPAGDVDTKATAASVAATDYAYTSAAPSAVLKNGANSAAIIGGGAVLGNANGQTTAAGPGGVAVIDTAKGTSTLTAGGLATQDLSGNTATVAPTGVTVSNSAGSITTVNAGVITLGGATAGYGITLNANADPIVTVTDGTLSGTTTIHNGDVAAGNSLKVGTGASTTTVTGGNVKATGTVQASTFTDGAGTTISGGNVTANTVSANVLSTNGYANVGTALTGINSTLLSQQGQITSLNGRMDKAYGGIAMATAFDKPLIGHDQKFGVSAGWGDFSGYNAGSINGAFRLTNNLSLAGGIAFSQGGQVAGKVAAGFSW